MNEIHEITLTTEEAKAILDLIDICQDEEFCLAEELFAVYERLSEIVKER